MKHAFRYDFRSRLRSGAVPPEEALAPDSWYSSTPNHEALWPIVPMPTPRYGASAVAYGGKIHVLGGFNGTTIFTTHEAYDPATNSWETLAALPAARWLGHAFALPSGIFYAGGASNTAASVCAANVYEYDHSGNSWTALTLDDIPVTTRSAQVGVFGNVAYLIMGLTNGNPGGTITRARKFDFNQVAGSRWTTLDNLAVQRNAAAYGKIGSLIYFAGGFEVSTTKGDTFTYEENTLTELTSDDLPQMRTRLGRGDTALGGKLYIASGTDSAGVEKEENYEFDPSQSPGSRFTARAVVPLPVRYFAPAVLGGIMYYFGGWDGSASVARVQAYVPPAGANRPY